MGDLNLINSDIENSELFKFPSSDIETKFPFDVLAASLALDRAGIKHTAIVDYDSRLGEDIHDSISPDKLQMKFINLDDSSVVNDLSVSTIGSMITAEDTKLADEIRTYYKYRVMQWAMSSNEMNPLTDFRKKLMKVLSSDQQTLRDEYWPILRKLPAMYQEDSAIDSMAENYNVKEFSKQDSTFPVIPWPKLPSDDAISSYDYINLYFVNKFDKKTPQQSPRPNQKMEVVWLHDCNRRLYRIKFTKLNPFTTLWLSLLDAAARKNIHVTIGGRWEVFVDGNTEIYFYSCIMNAFHVLPPNFSLLQGH